MKTKIFLFFASIVLVFSLITLYQYYNEDLSELEAARASSNSTFLESETGVTRYQVFGERNQPTIILIHSFNGFIESWNRNINALVDAGYRVVAYDLYGRGLSDRPRIKYDLSLFRKQLNLIIRKVGANKVHLMGSSFGCVIASDYAINYPDKVDSLIMVGPAGWPKKGEPSPLLNVPIVSDLAFHYFGENIIKPKVDAYLLDQSKHTKVIEQWLRFANYPGFTRSALSTMQNAPVMDYITGWEKLNSLSKPTLFIWGKQDVSFPFTNTKKLSKLIPHAKIIGINDAANWVNVEQAEMVNKAAIKFLSLQ